MCEALYGSFRFVVQPEIEERLARTFFKKLLLIGITAPWTLWPFGPYGPLGPVALWVLWPFGPYGPLGPLDPMALWAHTRAGRRMMNTREADEY